MNSNKSENEMPNSSRKKGWIIAIVAVILVCAGIGGTLLYKKLSKDGSKSNRDKSKTKSYSIGEYLKKSDQKPFLMYYTDGAEKDSAILSVFVVDKGKAAAFPVSMLKSQYGNATIGNFLKYDDETIIRDLYDGFRKQREHLAESLTNSSADSDENKEILESAQYWSIINETPYLSEVVRVIRPEESSDGKTYETLLLPYFYKGDNCVYIVNEHAEFYVADEAGLLHKVDDFADYDTFNGERSPFICFQCDGFVKGSFSGIPYAGMEQLANDGREKRCLIVKTQEEDTSFRVDTSKDGAMVENEQPELQLQEEAIRVRTDCLAYGYGPFEKAIEMPKEKIVMWSPAAEGDSNHQVYEKAIDEVRLLYPNVDIEWRTFSDSEAYKQMVSTAAETHVMPDIFITWSCTHMNDFVNDNVLYCLDETYKAYADVLPETMCRNAMFDGKLYAVPLAMTIAPMFVNMDLLNMVGYTEVPKTYEEFMQCCEALKARGIIPIGCSDSELRCISEFVESMLVKSCGAETVDKIFQGYDTWKNEDVTTAINLFQQMIVTHDYFERNPLALYNDEVQDNFLFGKYAFYIGGSWLCSKYKEGMHANIKIAEFPVINEEKSQLGEIIGGPYEMLATSTSSEKPELASEIMFEIGKRISKYSYLDGCGLPTWKIDYDDSNISPLTREAARFAADAKYLVLYGESSMCADDVQAYFEVLSHVYGSEITADEFTETVWRGIR